MSKPRIEIYNSTSGISILLPIEAAKEMVHIFEEEGNTNPSVAEAMRKVIEATEKNVNATEYVERA